MMSTTIRIAEIAEQLGKTAEEITLPNGQTRTSIVWRPEDLSKAFQMVKDKGFGRQDHVIFDGGAPGWLVACVVHACDPGFASVNYPQGDCTLPCNGYDMAKEGEGTADQLSFKVEDKDEYTMVEFSVIGDSLSDVKATLQSLIAPTVPHGKAVVISGRGPVAILSALADAYAHVVPAVAAFQPGTGNVVCLTHSEIQLGSIIG